MRGYKEKGNINTPMELAMNNEIDRYQSGDRCHRPRYRDSRRSEGTPRRNSGTSRSNAGPTRTRMASTRPRLPDGGGRTAPSDRNGRERVAGALPPAT